MIEIPSSIIEGRRFLQPASVDFVGPGPGRDSCSVRLSSGSTMTCFELSPQKLADLLAPHISFLRLRSGFLNPEAAVAVIANGTHFAAKLRGGTNAAIDADEIGQLQSAVAA